MVNSLADERLERVDFSPAQGDAPEQRIMVSLCPLVAFLGVHSITASLYANIAASYPGNEMLTLLMGLPTISGMVALLMCTVSKRTVPFAVAVFQCLTNLSAFCSLYTSNLLGGWIAPGLSGKLYGGLVGCVLALVPGSLVAYEPGEAAPEPFEDHASDSGKTAGALGAHRTNSSN